MRSSNLLFSGIHLVVVLLVIAVSALFITLPFSNQIQAVVVDSIFSRSTTLLSIGIPMAIFGLVMLIGFFQMHRKRYFKIQMGCAKTLVDESIIREYVKTYWQSVFPGSKSNLEIVILPKQKIEIITEFPEDKSISESLLERVKNELGVLLARRLGYEKEFILTITV